MPPELEFEPPVQPEDEQFVSDDPPLLPPL